MRTGISRSKRIGGGFTLVELLVVIAIVSVLAAMLFPAFARARHAANRAVCSSNLKQLATAVNLYCQDWNGQFPSASSVHYAEYASASAESAVASAHTYFCRSSYLRDGDVGWSDVVRPYTKDSAVVWCPSRGQWPGYPRTSYEFKLWFAFHTAQDQVLSPSNVAMIWEQWAYHSGWEPESDRRASLNIAFADGHVRYMSLATATTAGYPNGPDLHGLDQGGSLLESPYTRADFE